MSASEGLSAPMSFLEASPNAFEGMLFYLQTGHTACVQKTVADAKRCIEVSVAILTDHVALHADDSILVVNA